MPDDRLKNLINILKDMGSALLAFSGGADSALLLKALQIAGIKNLAVTASSEIFASGEISTAEETANILGAKHRVLRIRPAEDFLNNPPDRCYLCKAALFKDLADIALREGYSFVLDGSNTDDLMDYRPGRKAASEYRVRSPLTEAGFSKSDVRQLSERLGLPTWDKPSSSCLATRIPYGRRITSEALKRIELAEALLMSMGFRQVRVRDHGHMARIEIQEDEIDTILTPRARKNILEKLRSLGYKFVSLDLEGYKGGGMNRILGDHRL